jgi:hypothetical protein
VPLAQSAFSPLLFEDSIRSLGHHDYEELNSYRQIFSSLLVRFGTRHRSEWRSALPLLQPCDHR